jgi:1-acyl-sn-glycerol-3-phosphate acyltransferase
LISGLKFFIRAALWLFCSDINVRNKFLLNNKQPLLIIANHPNSFLDAIIIGAQYNRKVNFLARGDVFTKRHHRFLLRLLNMIPVYRQREGKQYLHLNEYAFNETVRLIKKGEAVLIFIEGICVNSNQLQPFKKGTTRIIEKLNQQNIFFKIHLVGIAYHNFRGINKKVNISICDFLQHEKITNAKQRIVFNSVVYEQLENNIFPPTQNTSIKKSFLYYFHLPYFNIIKKITNKLTQNTVFYDSVLFSILLFSYPLFLSLIGLILYIIGLPLPIIFIILLCLPIITKHTTIVFK